MPQLREDSEHRVSVLEVSFNMGLWSPSFLLRLPLVFFLLLLFCNRFQPNPPLGFHVTRPSTLFVGYYEFRNIIILATCFLDIEFQARSLYSVQCEAVKYLTFLLLCICGAISRATSCRGKCRKLHDWFRSVLCVGIYSRHRIVERNDLRIPCGSSVFWIVDIEMRKRFSRFLYSPEKVGDANYLR